MYRICTNFINGGSSSSCLEDLDKAILHAFTVFCEKDYLGRSLVKSVEVYERIGKG